MHTTTQLQSEWLINLLECAQHGLAYFEPVYAKDSDHIINFRLAATNQSGLPWLNLNEVPLGELTITVLFPWAWQTGLFDDMVNVCQTGTAAKREQRYPTRDCWVELTIRRVGDGVAIAFKDVTDDRIAVQERQQQAQMLRSVLDGSQNAIVAFDSVRNSVGQIVDFRYILQNEANRRRVGRSDEQLIGRTMLEFYPAVATNGLLERYSLVVQTGMPYRQEVEFNYGQGTGWYDVSVVKRDDGIVLTVQDKTAEKKAELTIRRQAETLQGILDTIPCGIFVSEAIRNQQGRIIDFTLIEVNQVALQLTGLTRSNTVGQLASVLFPHDRTNGAFDRFVNVVETGQPQRYEITWQRDENQTWLDVQLVPLGANRVIVSHTDITALKIAQQEQERQADFLDKIISTSQNAIITFDVIRDSSGQPVDFRCTYFNPAALSIMEVSAQDFRNRTLLERFPSDEFPGLVQFYIDLAVSGQSFRRERYYPHLNKWLDISGTLFGDGILLSFTDITANRLNLQRVEQANLELRRSNDHLQQFAYVASHDLQEPLRKIQQFGDMLHTQYGPQLDETATDLIQRMQRSSGRMAELIKDLLVYSRITTHQLPFQRVSLSAILSEVIEDLELTISETKAVIGWTELPYLMGDRNQLRQLFLNLLSNALKFRREKVAPEVRVFWQRVKAADLPESKLATALVSRNVTDHSTQHFYEISVEDNGIGFEEKYLDRIFQVFQRLHTYSTYPGTGIGLAICRKVVENHRGGLIASSQPGQGTTFRVYLPCEE